MAVQGIIYNTAMWAGPPGRPRVGVRRGGPTLRLFSGAWEGVGSCNPGTAVDGDGLILSPDSFILKDQPESCSILELSRV